MLTSVEVKGFRCFENLRVDGLAQVNLFVGKNNAGKTALLEAIEALTLGSPASLVRSPARRGEEVSGPDGRPSKRAPDIDPRHLFFGHQLDAAARIILQARTDGPEAECFFEAAADPDAQVPLAAEGRPDYGDTPMPGDAIYWRSRSRSNWRRLRLSPAGGLAHGLGTRKRAPDATPVEFWGRHSDDKTTLIRVWGHVGLDPEESGVLPALRLVEPSLEKINLLPSPSGDAFGAFFVRLRGQKAGIPLGSLGDGVRQMLALALHLAGARQGRLLVDDVDTGLHHSTMTGMWRLVIEAARNLDVQVFATTHSMDCIRALARASQAAGASDSDVRVQRIEREDGRTISYSLSEVSVAAEGRIEMR